MAACLYGGDHACRAGSDDGNGDKHGSILAGKAGAENEEKGIMRTRCSLAEMCPGKDKLSVMGVWQWLN